MPVPVIDPYSKLKRMYDLPKTHWLYACFLAVTLVSVTLCDTDVFASERFNDAAQMQPSDRTPSVVASGVGEHSVVASWRSAIAADDLNRLKTLLAKAPEARLLDITAPNGKSVLMVAAKRGDSTFVRLLVASGVDVSKQTSTRGNALMFAALGGHVDVSQFLVEQGVPIDAQGDNGWTALTIAVAKGHNDLLRWLIEQGADINTPDIYRWTPLMRAINNQQHDSAEILLDSADVLLDMRDEAGNTALHHAVIMKNHRLVRRLVLAGANAGVVNDGNFLPRQLLPDDDTAAKMLPWLQ